MRHVWPPICALLAAGLCLLALAQPAVETKPPQQTPPFPAPNLQTSPIDLFRKLLAMKEDQREAALTNRPPAQRKLLIQKLREYDILPPDAREIRLHQTELRWYVQTLINMPLGERTSKIAQVPDRDRATVEERLRQWDDLPADVQKQFLDNQNIVASYLERKTSPVPTALAAPTARQIKLDQELKRWEALPPDQRQQMCDLFRKFFELDEKQKQKMLGVLSESERLQIEHSVSGYTNLSRDQRDQRITSLKRFVSMSPEDRNALLQNAARWQALTPKEREIWRQLVVKLPPLPPLPPGLKVKNPQPPPMPPSPQ